MTHLPFDFFNYIIFKFLRTLINSRKYFNLCVCAAIEYFFLVGLLRIHFSIKLYAQKKKNVIIVVIESFLIWICLRHLEKLLRNLI